MDERVFIALGSNLDAEKSIIQALLMLQDRVRIIRVSTFYRSKAVGLSSEGDDFINGIVEVAAQLSPYKLKYDILRTVEATMGRKRGPGSCKSKIIDLDLLLYGDIESDTEELKLPDPDITSFPFISVPLLELAPDLILPGATVQLAAQVDVELELRALTGLESFNCRVRELFSNLNKR